MPKDDDCDSRVCERGKLMSLLEEACFSFEIGDLTVSTFLDRLDLDLFPSHGGVALEKRETSLTRWTGDTRLEERTTTRVLVSEQM